VAAVFAAQLALNYPGPPREFVGPGANLKCGALVYKYFDGDWGLPLENWTP